MLRKATSTPLIDAARKDDDKTDDLATALKAGSDINARDIHGYTALMWAVFNGHLSKVKFLIEKGANTNVTTVYHKNTILHLAIKQSNKNPKNYNALIMYIAERCSELLLTKGENNLLPSYMISQLSNNLELVKLFDQYYSLKYFGSTKATVPKELIDLIVNLADPTTIKKLSLTNKAWNQLALTEQYQQKYDQKIREYLPKQLRDLSWNELFKLYFPNTKMPTNAFDGFIKQIHYFYLLDTKIPVAENLSLLRLAYELFTKNFSKSLYKPVKINDHDVESKLKKKMNGNKLNVNIYRELTEAAAIDKQQVEIKEDKYKHETIYRHPIVEVQVNSQEALGLLSNNNKPLTTIMKNINAITMWCVGEEAELIDVDDIKNKHDVDIKMNESENKTGFRFSLNQWRS